MRTDQADSDECGAGAVSAVGSVTSAASVAGSISQYGADGVVKRASTGMIANGQAALYVTETTSGKIGVYSMGPRDDTQPGVQIKRHDLVLFRQPRPN